MFASLTDKLQSLFKNLAEKKRLDEQSLAAAVKEVRSALLEADVNYGIACQFVKDVKEAAIGTQLQANLSPDQQFIKVVHDKLVELMGGTAPVLHLKGSPAVIFMCGLQGSGKTTQSAKLAHHLKKQNKKVLLAACDLQRKAAVDQLIVLGKQVDVPVFSIADAEKPLDVAKKALEKAREMAADVLIVDTAGRLQIDAVLMEQLSELKAALNPSDTLFVVSAMIGQEAAKVAIEFDKSVGITGTILTMLDGSARAGAALSISKMTGKPLLFEGVGEKIEDLQPFNPRSMADRILGMGDLINLTRRIQEQNSEEEEKQLAKKIKEASFTYDTFLSQMAKMQKLGSISGLLKMLPGASNFQGLEGSEAEFKKVKAMIQSMTRQEREEEVELSASRRARIAAGSGTNISDVNRMVKSFNQLKEFAKQMPQMQKQMMQQGFGNGLKSALGPLLGKMTR